MAVLPFSQISRKKSLRKLLQLPVLQHDFLPADYFAANGEQVTGMVGHLQAAMDSVGFFDRRPPERLMRRMQAVFDRAQLEREEIDILRGFFHNIEKQVKKD